MQHMQRCVDVRVDGTLGDQGVFENAGMYDDDTVVPTPKTVFLLMISRTLLLLALLYYFTSVSLPLLDQCFART